MGPAFSLLDVREPLLQADRIELEVLTADGELVTAL